MKERLKKCLILIIAVIMVIPTVYAYDYVNPENAGKINVKRQEIYDWVEAYYNIVGGKPNTTDSLTLSNYSGMCSTVTVDGNTYTLEDYVAGVVKAELGAETHAPEALKAQAIAARSYLLSTSSCTSEVTNGQSYQAFSPVSSDSTTDQIYIKAANDTAGVVVTRNNSIAVTQYVSYPNEKFYTTTGNKWSVNFQKFNDDPTSSWTWVGPSKQTVLDASHAAPSSGAPSTTHHYGMSQTIAVYLDVIENYSYTDILSLFYGEKLETLSDGSYIGDLEFANSDFGNIYYFNQTDYKDYYYSSDTSVVEYYGSNGPATISSHGCGPTAVAIVVSSFLNRPIGPIETTEAVCSNAGCTSTGSYFGTLKTVIGQYGLTAYYAQTDQEAVDALSSGNALVIALMGPGTFTRGGHFIVLTGVRSDGYVSVADPASRKRTETKWFSFNTVVEETKSKFLIITR